MEPFDIGGRPIGGDEPAFVIAEAGSNHNGNLDIAKRLVDAAADAGADAIKFQTYQAEKMYPENRELYLQESDQTAYELFKRLEMPYEWIEEIHKYAQSREILFMSTPFDRESANELNEYVPAFKVASSLLVHHPFLEFLSQMDKPIILSTGAKSRSQVADAIEVIRGAGDPHLVVLQCTTAYPTPIDRANLLTIKSLREAFDVHTGLSDHTLESDIAPITAVGLGARVIEKHLTLDDAMEGPDHSFSLEPDEFDRMVTKVRNAESALGAGKKRVLDVEERTPTGEPTLHATKDLSPGDVLTRSNTAFLRPVDDKAVLLPSRFSEVEGAEIADSLEPGDKIRIAHLDVQDE